MASAMAGSMRTCPTAITAPAGSTPSQYGGNSTTNDRYIASDISRTDAAEWRRHTIQAAMPRVIQVAMSSESISIPRSPTSIDTGMRTTMPTTIATSICR